MGLAFLMIKKITDPWKGVIIYLVQNTDINCVTHQPCDQHYTQLCFPTVLTIHTLMTSEDIREVYS